MSRGTAWLLHVAVLAMGASGLLLFWAVYIAGPPVGEPAGQEVFAVQHPWQPWSTAVHVLAGPLLVFACGMVWQVHAWPKIACGARLRRRTGVVLASVLVPMIACGYALQVLEDGDLRGLCGWVHCGAAALFLAGYLLHLRAPREPDDAE